MSASDNKHNTLWKNKESVGQLKNFPEMYQIAIK